MDTSIALAASALSLRRVISCDSPAFLASSVVLFVLAVASAAPPPCDLSCCLVVILVPLSASTFLGLGLRLGPRAGRHIDPEVAAGRQTGKEKKRLCLAALNLNRRRAAKLVVVVRGVLPF